MSSEFSNEKIAIKTTRLESDIDHISSKVERFSVQLEKSLPLLSKINIRMEDDIARRLASEKIQADLVEKVSVLRVDQNESITIRKYHEDEINILKEAVSSIRNIADKQLKHGEIISKHDVEIDKLKDIFVIFTTSKSYLKGVKWLAGLIFLLASIWYAYSENERKKEYNMDRAQAYEINLREIDLERRRVEIENEKFQVEFEEKKKRLDANLERYKIKNGV